MLRTKRYAPLPNWTSTSSATSGIVLPELTLADQLASGITPKKFGVLPNTKDEIATALDDFIDELPFAYSAPTPEPTPETTPVTE